MAAVASFSSRKIGGADADGHVAAVERGAGFALDSRHAADRLGGRRRSRRNDQAQRNEKGRDAHGSSLQDAGEKLGTEPQAVHVDAVSEAGTDVPFYLESGRAECRCRRVQGEDRYGRVLFAVNEEDRRPVGGFAPECSGPAR